MSSVSAEVLTAPIVKPKSSRDDWTMRAFMGVIALYLVISLAMPLFMMLASLSNVARLIRLKEQAQAPRS